MDLSSEKLKYRVRRRMICGLTLLFTSVPTFAQVASRAEAIQQERLDKQARSWPENTSGLVTKFNSITERGLVEGIQSGKGSNGFQLVMGGQRSGHGTTVGIGYRRMDLFNEKLGFRATARGTRLKAYMFDLELNSPRLATGRTEVQLYMKYENSPQMDYYGPGPNSSKSGRSSYRLEDLQMDFGARYRVWNHLYAGGSLGGYVPNTGPGTRDGYPPTNELYPPAVVPGLNQQENFIRSKVRLEYDYRDLPRGPRSGGNYRADYWRYWDQDKGTFNFTRIDLMADQYLPYWNKTRVLAVHFATVGVWAPTGNQVPFFLQPTLGGNEALRGFERYRFYDQNSILLSLEHRWHVFTGGHAALFWDMGKVARKSSQLNFHNMEHSAGVGLRFTLKDAVFMRIDLAGSREGFRFLWTFSNPW